MSLFFKEKILEERLSNYSVVMTNLGLLMRKRSQVQEGSGIESADYPFAREHQMEVRWSDEMNSEGQHVQCYLHDDKVDIAKEKKEVDVKKFIDKKANEYINGFTVHGLTRIFTSSKCESCFWLFILICGIVLAAHIIHGRLSKYYQFDIYTEISSKITKRNSFPSISFCEANLLVNTFFAYCGQNIGFIHPQGEKVCPHVNVSFPEIDIYDGRGYWTNGMFNVTACRTWGGKMCTSNEYFMSLRRYNHSCITWNYNGNLYDIYGHTEIELQYKSPKNWPYPPKIYAIPHDADIQEIDLTKKIHLDPEKIYDVKIDKSVVKRLPSPFPSNCTYGKAGDIFPGKYSRRACIESHNYINMFKECGDTLDYVRKFIPEDIRLQFGRNDSIRDVKTCILKYSQKQSDNAYDCPFPCVSHDISAIPTFHEFVSRKRDSSKRTYILNIQFEHIDTVRTIEEKELYSWYQMTCEIGGFVGLVIGASLISCIEILACITLLIMRKVIP